MGSESRCAVSDRDGMTVRGQWVRHTTLQRDWLCGCGSRLVLRAFQNDTTRSTDWRTVCFRDQAHDPDTFIHKHKAAVLESQRMAERAEARQVFAHLPIELQAAITERRNTCPSKD